MCMDVKCFYLNNQMDRSGYIMIQISMIPQECVDNTTSSTNLKMDILARITKGIYGLPQSELISHDALFQQL